MRCLTSLVAVMVALFCTTLANGQESKSIFGSIGVDLMVAIYDGSEAIVPSRSGGGIDVGFTYRDEVDGGPVISVGGRELTTVDAFYDANQIRVRSWDSDSGLELLTVFSVQDDGGLVTEFSTPDEGVTVRFVVGSTSTAEVCLCWGGDKTTVKGPCTNAQCNDPGTSCQTAGTTALCQWRTIVTSQDVIERSEKIFGPMLP